jgi:hypothetical protein
MEQQIKHKRTTNQTQGNNSSKEPISFMNKALTNLKTTQPLKMEGPMTHQI